MRAVSSSYHLFYLTFASMSPNDSYFPLTPSPSDADSDKQLHVPPSTAVDQMATLAPTGPGPAPNGAHGASAKARATSPSRVAPAKISLNLGHLPSKKDVKAVYPRTPSRVSRLCLIHFSTLIFV